MNIITRPVPTGGGFLFSITEIEGSNMTITRNDPENGTLTVYQGLALAMFLDIGEPLPSVLQPDVTYTYNFIDDSGSYEVITSFPNVVVTPQVDNMTYQLIRLIRGAMQNMQVPPQIKKAEVLQSVPVSRSVKLPAIFINQDLIQQDRTPIGRNIGIQPMSDSETMIISALVRRRFSIYIEAMDSMTTNFYHDVMIALITSLMNHVFGEEGLENSINYSFQSTGGMAFTKENQPTFYYSQIALDFTGPLNISLTYTPLGITKSIEVTLDSAISGTVP